MTSSWGKHFPRYEPFLRGIIGRLPTQRVDVFFVVSRIKRLKKTNDLRWFEKPWHLWQCDVIKLQWRRDALLTSLYCDDTCFGGLLYQTQKRTGGRLAVEIRCSSTIHACSACSVPKQNNHNELAMPPSATYRPRSKQAVTARRRRGHKTSLAWRRPDTHRHGRNIQRKTRHPRLE